MDRDKGANDGQKPQAILGFLAALISIGVVLGSLLLAFTESGTGRAFNKIATVTVSQSPIPILTSKPTQTPGGQIQFEPTPTLTGTATEVMEKAVCPPPSGWVVITVRAGDTLESLAQVNLINVQVLKEANCLVTNRLLPGVLLYVPGKPTEPATATPLPMRTATPCGPPRNWFSYRIQPGDTLYSIAMATSSTVRELQLANCLSSPDRIRVGQIIYLPSQLVRSTPTSTPSPTLTKIPAVTPSADISIGLAAAPNPVNPGANLDITISIGNNGPNTAFGLIVEDTLPAGTSFVSAVGGGWSCSSSGGVVSCTLASLPASGNSSINLRAAVAGSASGALTNQANVTSSTSDPNPANNSASQNITITSQADLALSMTVSTNSATIGTPVNYSITILNNGPSTAASLQLTDLVDVNGIGVSGISASGTGWTCTSGTTVSCSLSSLASGASSTVSVTVQANAAGTLTNQANVSSSVNDPNTGNNAGSLNSTITAQSDLAVGITGPTVPVNINDTVSYTITVTNNGPNAASNLQVTDIVDSNGIGFQGVTASGAGWNCAPGGTITCTMPNLASSASSTISISVQPTGSGILRNSVSVTSTIPDPNNSNNSAVKDISVN